MQIDDTAESGLLHLSNMSWHRIGSVADVMNVGDRVRAVVIGMDEGFTRISLSTKDIESAEGEMLRDPQAVYEKADETVKRFQQHINKWEDAEMQKDSVRS